MDKDIIAHFQHIKSLITEGKGKALQAATVYELTTYWNIGAYLNQRLTEKTYGNKIVSQLAEWLLQQESTLKGFDKRSLYRMRDFFEAWEKVDWSIIPSKFQKDQIYTKDLATFEAQKIVVTLSPQSFGLPNVLSRLTWSQYRNTEG